MLLRRFIARRGQVEEFRSDNGANLVGGARELKDCIKNWNQEQIHSYLLQKNIKWRIQRTTLPLIMVESGSAKFAQFAKFLRGSAQNNS